MFDLPEPARNLHSIFESYSFVKILEEQSEDFQRHSNMPFYVRLLLKKRHEFHLDYLKTRTRALWITCYKLNKIYKDESTEIEENGTIANPNSLFEILEKLQKELLMAELWYRKTNMKMFWDIFVGLFNVKAVLYGIKDIKKVEYDVLRLIE